MAWVVNRPAIEYLKRLIDAGRIDTGPWDFDWAKDVPNDAVEDFGRRYCLAHRDDGDPETKAYWGYPVGKDGKIYRRGVIAAKAAAAGARGAEPQPEIQRVATQLLEAIDEKLQLTAYIGKPAVLLEGDYEHPRYRKDLINLAEVDAKLRDAILKAVKAFARQKELGIEVPLIYPEAEWSGSHPDTEAQKTRGKVGVLLDLEVDGDIIYATVEVRNPEVAERMERGELNSWSLAIVLEGTAKYVEGEIEAPYFDHIALTADPAVASQSKRFVRLEAMPSIIERLWLELSRILGRDKSTTTIYGYHNSIDSNPKQEVGDVEDTKSTMELEALRKELEAERARRLELERKQLERELTPLFEAIPNSREPIMLLLGELMQMRDRKITLERKDSEPKEMDIYELARAVLLSLAPIADRAKKELTSERLFEVPNPNADITMEIERARKAARSVQGRDEQ